ncbi:ferritin-like domain-containing protein [Akkermansiaceae bacterium]|nr:ferritin-like domain-containing protein [Akkermansiaceae bacterium]MDA7888195.1 ferritin-like domain-containing protein [Akkermansiaceae bacterium]
MSDPSTVSEFAQRVLMSDLLEEKLTHAPRDLILDPPSKSIIATPDTPGRPGHLLPSSNEGRSPFPGSAQIEDEEQRAILLHFFANHELLAVELMALALLKFPDAPDAFRKGVLHTLQEEQNHTRWYLKRMEECGVQFGDYHLSPMIWSHISPMESPLDYVSTLSLTFEQANLDYAKHYSEILAQAGDQKSAKILAKIYHDEIAHVGHGLKWLRRWKEQSQSDWDAWHKQLHFPVSPIRAKGKAPFNEEGRRLAGLDENFISSLRRYQSSRGRSPDLYYFNPDAEPASAHRGWKAPKRLEELAADLEYAFALAIPTEDDLVLLRRFPTNQHRDFLSKMNLHFPEVGLLSDIDEVRKNRKFRDERPWGHASKELLSKEIGLALRALVDESPIPSAVCSNKEEAITFIAEHPHQEWLAKPLHSSAGRGNKRFHRDSVEVPKGDFLIEPWLEKVMEFSLLYQVGRPEQGGIRCLGLSRQVVSKDGQWLSSTSYPKPAIDMPSNQAQIISNQVMPRAKKEFCRALKTLLEDHDYLGPLCIDSFLYRDNDELKWHPVSEVNVRWSMGRLAHQLRKRLRPDDRLTLTTCSPGDARTMTNGFPLGDPDQASTRVPVVKF